MRIKRNSEKPQRGLKHLDFFMARMPALPRCHFDAWCRSKAHEDDRAFVASLWESPVFREAIYIASPPLYRRVLEWLNGGKPDQKIVQTIVKYFTRITTRATPFGLFSSVSLGQITPKKSLNFAGLNGATRACRPDTGYLNLLSQQLTQHPELRAGLRFFSNSSLYNRFDRLRYVEYSDTGQQRAYKLSSVECTEYLEAIITCTRSGATLKELCEQLMSFDDISEEEAREFLDELLAAKLLVSELEPPITGLPPFEHLLNCVLRIAPASELAQQLTAIKKEIDDLSQAPFIGTVEAYESIVKKLVLFDIPIERDRAFQVDLFSDTPQLSLPESFVHLVQECAELFLNINLKSNPALDEFTDLFRKKYETREVPFLEVIDEETGIEFRGFVPEQSSLIAGLGISPTRSLAGGANTPWNGLLMRELSQALHDGTQSIALSRNMLTVLGQAHKSAEEVVSMSSLLTLTGIDLSDEKASSPLAIVKYFGTTSGADMMGRFCHGSPAIENKLKHLVEREEANFPDAILAEVVHLPQGRLGNISARPVLRNFEIVYLGGSGVPHDHQILLSDLTIAYRGGKLVLKSKRLGKRIIPRLSSAHNFSSPTNLRAYQLLCLFQQSSARSFGFAWPEVFQSAPYLPRVTYENKLILSPARWLLNKEEVEKIKTANSISIRKVMDDIRSKRMIPTVVCIQEGDNILPVCFENPLSLENFKGMLRNRQQITLHETGWLGEDVLRDEKGQRYEMEVLIPYMSDPPTSTANQTLQFSSIDSHSDAPKRPIGSDIKTTAWLPGSDWLYLKYYCSTNTADRILREIEAEIVSPLLSSNQITSWFFIRYGDPDCHLRLRFRGDAHRLVSVVLPMLLQNARVLADRGCLSRVQIDTYEPEVDRYGGFKVLPLCENYFYRDSEAALKVLSRCEDGNGVELRWQAAVLSCHYIFNDFSFTLPERMSLLDQAVRGFSAEFALNKAQEIEIGHRFRKVHKTLDQVIEGGVFDDLAWGFIHAAFRERGISLEKDLNAIKTIIAEATSGESLASLVSSLLHMSVNRLLRSSHRQQELVIYEYLRRYYQSAWSRSNLSRVSDAES